MRGNGYEGVPATNPGVTPPRIVFPDSVDALVGMARCRGELDAVSSSMGDTRGLSACVAEIPLADISRSSRSRASFSRYSCSCCCDAAERDEPTGASVLARAGPLPLAAVVPRLSSGPAPAGCSGNSLPAISLGEGEG